MNYLDIDKALVDITRAKCNECKARLDAVAKDNKAERKALQIELGMYTLCGNAGLLFNTYGTREGLYRTRQNFFNYILTKSPKHQEVYNALDEDEKLRFMAAWQADLFMRDQLLNGYITELAQAEAAGDAKNTFELRIKIGAVREMLSIWEAWRAENGVYPQSDGGEITMVNTKFYKLANEALSHECARMESFTDALDKDPAAKKEQIAEYKCAKYRYAAVSAVHVAIHNINRCRGLHGLQATHYLLLPFDELFKQHGDYLALYDAAAEADKPDYSLYYAMLAFIESETAKLESKLPHASDWKTVELTERIGGLRFAKVCLDEAWAKREV